MGIRLVSRRGVEYQFRGFWFLGYAGLSDLYAISERSYE